MEILIAGVDEAGRGPLAGPVVSAAVILPAKISLEGLTDSKKLSEKMREKLFAEIIAQAISYGIGFASVQEIDEINILQASLLSMKRAVENLSHKPQEVWVDGNFAPSLRYPTKTFIGGDLSKAPISAASIIAKVTRDRIMLDYDKKYPQYGFSAHKGYATEMHRKALEEFGACPLHRRSFAPVREALLRREAEYEPRLS